MSIPRPEIEATITLLPASSSPRTKPLNWLGVGYFGCPMVLPSGMWDVRMVFPKETAPVPLGSTVEAHLQFLSPQKVLPQLTVGTEFQLWDGKIFGNGRVTKIL